MCYCIVNIIINKNCSVYIYLSIWHKSEIYWLLKSSSKLNFASANAFSWTTLLRRQAFYEVFWAFAHGSWLWCNILPLNTRNEWQGAQHACVEWLRSFFELIWVRYKKTTFDRFIWNPFIIGAIACIFVEINSESPFILRKCVDRLLPHLGKGRVKTDGTFVE